MHVQVSARKVPAILPGCAKEELSIYTSEFHQVHIEVQPESSEIHGVAPVVAVLVGADDIPLKIITNSL
jgi:hypothetical protein